MRNTSKNPVAAEIYGELSDEDVAKQIVALSKAPLGYYRKAIYDVFDQPEEKEIADKLYTRLVNRLEYMKKWAVPHIIKTLKKQGPVREEKFNIPVDQSEGELTDEEKDEIADYTGSGYEHINSALRSGGMSDQTREKIEKIISGMKKLPAHKGRCYRGSRLDENLIYMLSKLKPGSVIYSKAFLSTSSDNANFFYSKPVHFYIDGKTGRNIKAYSGFSSENEVLFAPDTRFEVTKYYAQGDKHVIEMRELLPDENVDAKPINLKSPTTTPEDISRFLLRNPKLTQKQKERIIALSPDELKKVMMAIIIKSKGHGKGGSEEDNDKLTEVFV